MDIGNTIEIKFLQDASILSRNELRELYTELASVYSQQQQIIDRYKQRIYKLEQENTLKDNVVEDMAEDHERELNEVRRELAGENKELLSRIAEMNLTIDGLKQENEYLKSEVEEIRKKPSFVQKKCYLNEVLVSTERMEYLNKIETEHILLVNEIDDLETQKCQIMTQLMQSQKNLDELKERYECSQENLRTKAVELDDAKNALDTIQEKMMNIENELALSKNCEIDHNKKGNSLFAEVDDQRQQMRDLLNRQKQQYQMMKQKYNESHSEIKRLKRENADIHDEITECIAMFKNADKFHKSKLNEHIGFLKTENSRLNEKLKQTQSEMDSLAKAHGVKWLSSMLEYCENETKDLNQKLMSYGMKKCEAESLYVQAKEDAAKWRFEALKSRCMIMKFEMFLEKNNLHFSPKLYNIRQLVPKMFDENDVPIINNSLKSPADFDAIHLDNFYTALDSKDENQINGSWTEIKKIFESHNGPDTYDNIKESKFNRTKNVEFKNETDEKYKINSESNERSGSPKSSENEPNSDISNREAFGAPKQASKETDSRSITHAPSVSKICDQNTLIHSTSDISSHVRQLNVQVYTVTLRGEGSRTSKNNE